MKNDGKNEFAPGTILEIFDLYKQLYTYKQIAEKLNISKNKVISDLQRNPTKWTRRTKEERAKSHSTYTEDQKAECLRLRLLGMSNEAIEKQTGVNEGTIRSWCRKERVLLSKDQHRENLRHEDISEKRPEIIKLKKLGISNDEISRKTSTPLSTIKRIFRENDIEATPETISKNLSIARQPIVDKAKLDFYAKVIKRDGVVLGDYLNSITPVLLKCKNAHEWAMKPGLVLNNNQWCAKCFNISRQGPNSFIAMNKLKELGFTSQLERYAALAASFGGICLATENSVVHKYVDWQCSKGHVWGAQAYSVIQGSRCPYCANVGPSKGQMEIFDYCQLLLPGVEIQLSNRKVLNVLAMDHPKYRWPLELDVYIPSHNFAIEFNGLYWHCSALDTFKPGKERIKAITNQKLGNKYLMIFEDEWYNKKDLVKSMIRWRLNCFNGVSLAARDKSLKLELIRDTKLLKSFFNRNHLEGYGRSPSFSYGLFLDGKLIQCAMVLKEKEGDEFELLRLATDYDYRIQGGTSRLIKAIKANTKEANLFSFSNNRLSEGDIYSRFGIEEITETEQAGYFYTDTKKRISRQKCRKVKGPEIPEELSSEELQALGGIFSWKDFGDNRPLYKIEDAGHRKWLL